MVELKLIRSDPMLLTKSPEEPAAAAFRRRGPEAADAFDAELLLTDSNADFELVCSL
jgi:hypothetical protein